MISEIDNDYIEKLKHLLSEGHQILISVHYVQDGKLKSSERHWDFPNLDIVKCGIFLLNEAIKQLSNDYHAHTRL